MKAIFYFSSTGNSLFIAKEIQKKTGQSIYYIPTYEGDMSHFEEVIVVSPIHSFGLPKVVYDFLPKISKAAKLDVVLNYGGMTCGAERLTYDYCVKLGLNVASVQAVKMVENFTLFFTVPKFFSNAALKNAPKLVERVADNLLANAEIVPKATKTKESLYLKNMSNWHRIADDFSTDGCVLCGKCVRLCPSHNIRVENGKIVFGDACTACLACYHRCPHKAIKYKRRNKKFRYVNPFVEETDIGKDFVVVP